MKLITWNVQWCRGCDGTVDPWRIARELRAIGDADVICLQEVAVNFPGLAGSSGEDQVELLRAAMPEYEAHYGVATDLPCRRGGRSRFGNLILSRLPVLQVFRHLLPWPADPAVSSMQRVCVEATVESRFGPLRVMTTHLEYYSPMQRMAQVDALCEIHRQGYDDARHPRSDKEQDSSFAVVPRGAGAVLCGDFNFRPDSPEHARLTAAFDDGTPAFRDAWRHAHPGQPSAHTVGLHGAEWPDEPYCCDFLFLTEDLAPRIRSVEVDQATDASDHQPMWMILAD